VIVPHLAREHLFFFSNSCSTPINVPCKMDFDGRHRDLLQLLHLSPQDHKTCLGNAKSTGQQCRCVVAAKNRNRASQILLAITTTLQSVEDAKQQLAVVAGLLLCKRYHQGQSIGISSSWTEKIRVSDFALNNHNNSTGTNQEAQSPQSQLVDTVQHSRQLPDGATRTPEAMATTRARRRRGPDRPLSVSLRSAAEITRESYQECGICQSGYGATDRYVHFCRVCKNIVHEACGEQWGKVRSNACPYW
jgi:hypothetical protein